MCSKNQEVGHLIRPIHNKSLFDSENFSSFAKFAFQNKRPDDNIRTTLILSKNIQLFYAIPIPVNILKFTADRSSVHFVLVVKLNQLTFSRQWRIFIFHLDGVDHLSVNFPAREGLGF